MSKTRKSIQTFLKTFRPADETHEKAIGYFCMQRHLAVKINCDEDQRPTITYEQFKAWFESDCPELGDIVFLPGSNTIGIVKLAGLHTLHLCLSLSQGRLNTTPHAVPADDYRPATLKELRLLQRALNEKSLNWNKRSRKVVERKLPANNQRVQINIVGKKIGYGVFREIDAADMLVMYVFKKIDSAVRYSLREVVGPAQEYQLEQINVSQNQEFTTDMEKDGKTWNGFHRRVEPVDFRAHVGENYWYITEGWEVRQATDNNKAKDIARFKGGNYFKNDALAKQFCEGMIEQRNNLLAKMTQDC